VVITVVSGVDIGVVVGIVVVCPQIVISKVEKNIMKRNSLLSCSLPTSVWLLLFKLMMKVVTRRQSQVLCGVTMSHDSHHVI
jgi:hypothetical protein